MNFSEDFLKALADWQKGWREIQADREKLANQLEQVSKDLSDDFRRVGQPCYRKRFLHYGELIDIILTDEKLEGMVSWTINQEYAEIFKGLCKPGAVSGAIFEHTPEDEEVVVNICALWQSESFISAVNSFKGKYPEEAAPLLNFRDVQGEVVLMSSLKGSEIIALTGASSPFDDLCEREGIPIGQRDNIYTRLVQSGVYPGELKYTSKEGTRRVIENTIKRMHNKILEYKLKP